jgi:hypothetical protein
MGQQQLLLIAISVILVGVSIAVGVTQFRSSAVDTNRQAIISDLINLAAKAQRYYKTPTTLAGGGQDFGGFALSPADTGNTNGSYSISTIVPADTNFVAGSVEKLEISCHTLYITACGKEVGNDNVNAVKAFLTVTPSITTTTILN